MTQAYLLDENGGIQEIVHVIESYGKAYAIERYDPVTETWNDVNVNAVRISPLTTWDDLHEQLSWRNR